MLFLDWNVGSMPTHPSSKPVRAGSLARAIEEAREAGAFFMPRAPRSSILPGEVVPFFLDTWALYPIRFLGQGYPGILHTEVRPLALAEVPPAAWSKGEGAMPNYVKLERRIFGAILGFPERIDEME